jgi:hypothetical protein
MTVTAPALAIGARLRRVAVRSRTNENSPRVVLHKKAPWEVPGRTWPGIEEHNHPLESRNAGLVRRTA